MTARVWDIAKENTLNMEGGYQCDPDDKGNWTGGQKGIGVLKAQSMEYVQQAILKKISKT